MSQQACEQSYWQAVLKTNPLESHDPAEWLGYGAALLHTIEQGRQQQQSAQAQPTQALQLVLAPAEST